MKKSLALFENVLYLHILITFQAILCTRDVGIKARQAAYTLLVEIGKTFIRFENSDEDHEGKETSH